MFHPIETKNNIVNMLFNCILLRNNVSTSLGDMYITWNSSNFSCPFLARNARSLTELDISGREREGTFLTIGVMSPSFVATATEISIEGIIWKSSPSAWLTTFKLTSGIYCNVVATALITRSFNEILIPEII